MSADKQLAAFVDRVLRMKEEADGIAEDIKAIYAEAKAEGYDKTQLGNLVTYLRKRAKDKDGEAEKEAVFDLYLTAYMRAKGEVGTVRATHTHASEPPLTKAAGQAQSDAVVDSAVMQSGATSLPGAEGAEDREPIQPETANEAGDEIGHVAADAPDQGLVDAGNDADNRNPGGENVDAPEVPATQRIDPAIEGGQRADAEALGSAVESGASNITTFKAKPLRPHCLRPEKCGGQGKEHCWSCKKAMNDVGAA